MRIALVSPKGPLYRHRGGIFGRALRYKPPMDLTKKKPPGGAADAKAADAKAANGKAADGKPGDGKPADKAADGKEWRRGDGERPHDMKTVWVLGAAGPESKRIKIGVTDGTYTEVVEGLEVGTAVITEAIGTSSGPPPGMPSGGRRIF